MQFGQLKRREFVTMLGGAAVAAWPLGARAQQPGRRPTIGFLGVSTASAWTHWTAAFVRRLGELGWIDGRNVAIEYRWAEGRSDRYVEFAAELVRLKVDVIVTGGSAVPAAMQATSTIPIVFALAVDALVGGLVTSLARPGGNVTGLSVLSNETASKRIEILREVIPGLRRLAVLGNAAYAGTVDEMREVKTAAQAPAPHRPDADRPSHSTLTASHEIPSFRRDPLPHRSAAGKRRDREEKAQC